MSEAHLDSVFQNDTDPPTVLFTPQRRQGPGRPGILLRVHPTTEEETAGCGAGGRVRVFTSRLFMRHHGLQRLGRTGMIRALEPVGLDRVVLGARGRQILRWASAGRFTTGLLELCRRGEWLLARQGDPLLLPWDPLLGEDPGQVRLGHFHLCLLIDTLRVLIEVILFGMSKLPHIEIMINEINKRSFSGFKIRTLNCCARVGRQR